MALTLNRLPSVFVLSNIIEILAGVRATERERDSRFVELSRYV